MTFEKNKNGHGFAHGRLGIKGIKKATGLERSVAVNHDV